MDINIRLEQENDYRLAEELTREAFWNLYVPGADEHFLLHKLRKSPGFIKDLDFVAIKDNEIVGHIIYSKSMVKDEAGLSHETITFGPVSVLPQFQGQGIGAALIEYSIKAAKNLGYKALIIYGYPDYYQRFGFKTSKEFGISTPDGRYMKALLALELFPGSLNGIKGKFFEDPAFNIDKTEFEAFDKTFPPKEKKFADSQKKFEEMASLLA